MISGKSGAYRVAIAGLLALTAGGLATVPATAQPTTAPAAARTRAPDPIPQRETLIRLSRPITVEFREQRLADVISFLRDFTSAEIEPMWLSDRQMTGLDPDQLITFNARNITVLTLIERVLEQAGDDFSQSTWQMSDTGAIQIGPRERLNRWRRVEVYDVNDLLMEIPDYPEVPRIDLNQALQGSQGGGGGGQSPFQGDQDDDRERRRTERNERAEELADLIREVVEMEQWIENGGTGGSIRVYRGNLIIRAPDYMHRNIRGYPYWPSSATRSQAINGRRYVSLTTDNQISTLAGMALQPVGAGAGGGGGGGGGGGTPGGPPGGGG